jgi:hypothetical protein
MCVDSTRKSTGVSSAIWHSLQLEEMHQAEDKTDQRAVKGLAIAGNAASPCMHDSKSRNHAAAQPHCCLDRELINGKDLSGNY